MANRAGLILSDSILKQLPYHLKKQLLDKYQLNNLQCAGFSGYNTNDLIGKEGVIHNLRPQKCQVLFLCSGANDFNQMQAGNKDVLASRVAKEFYVLVHTLSSQYPNLKIILCPIPGRKVTQDQNVIARHPTSGDEDWINIRKEAIDKLNQCQVICNCHSNNVFRVTVPSATSWERFLNNDGIHLTDHGKKFLIGLICSASSKYFVPQLESVNFNSFPELKTGPITSPIPPTTNKLITTSAPPSSL